MSGTAVAQPLKSADSRVSLRTRMTHSGYRPGVSVTPIGRETHQSRVTHRFPVALILDRP